MLDFKKLAKSFHYAALGIHYAFRNNQNLLVHIIVGVLVILASIFFDINPFEIGILGVTILVVISAEMVNSAIEQMVDLITKEHRQEAKIAKDVSAGMVLLSTIGAVIIGLLIFIPHILDFFSLAH